MRSLSDIAPNLANHAVLAAIATAGVLVSMLVLRQLLRSPSLVHVFADRPGHRKVHQFAIPRLGGIGITAAFLFLFCGATIFQLWSPEPRLFGVFLFTAVFLLISGGLDDAYSLGYKAKFILQFTLALVVVTVFGVQLEQVSFLGKLFTVGDWGVVLSIFWMVALMNAVNIIDGIDGLAGGVALFGFLGVAALAHLSGASEVVWICVALAGATAGFLRYNLSRRKKIFLGDTGSQFLGASLGLLTLHTHALPAVNHSILIPVLLVGYPVFDTSVAMARRFLRVPNRELGQRVTSMFQADNEHVHHRLVYAGLSHVQAALLLMMLTSGFVATAIIAPLVSWQWEAGIVAYFGAALLFLLNRLGFLRRGSLRRALGAALTGGVSPEVAAAAQVAVPRAMPGFATIYYARSGYAPSPSQSETLAYAHDAHSRGNGSVPDGNGNGSGDGLRARAYVDMAERVPFRSGSESGPGSLPPDSTGSPAIFSRDS